MNLTDDGLLAPLRPYQLEAAQAILGSVNRRQGLSFSVEIARQGGKNELSARIELLLLMRNGRKAVTNIKAAPTLKPQAMISSNRLWEIVRHLGVDRLGGREGSTIRIGEARQVFLSAEPHSNIVGHSAGLLLEVDEAQDVAIEKYDKELRPMAASTGATTVFYGTAWDDANLLERARQEHLEAERLDGVQRHFEYDWQTVAAYNPAYERYVRLEEQRLGAGHPTFLTQYCLQPLPGRGHLLNATQLSLLQGSHPCLETPRSGETYVAGLDIGGGAAAGQEGGHDLTVLTIGRVVPASDGLLRSAVEVVKHFAWQGAPHDLLHGALLSLLRDVWKVRKVCVDATGLGEALASFLARALGDSRVIARKLGAESKSQLGYDLLAAVNSGRVRLYAGDAAERRECLRQLEVCRVAFRPSQTMKFYVEPRDGHDDYVISLALLAATLEAASPRRARGREQEQAAIQRFREDRQW